MRKIQPYRRLGALSLLIAGSLYTVVGDATDIELDRCLIVMLRDASDDMTVGELRAACGALRETSRAHTETATPSANRASTDNHTDVRERMAAEEISEQTPWLITPHKPNYLLPATYNDNLNRAPYPSDEANEFSATEAKLQLSLKIPVVRNLFSGRSDVYFAYTNQSYWQLYAQDASSPFRETNHEAELFITFKNNWEIMGWENSLLTAGVTHQSNGRSMPLSRSWNRIYLAAIFERDHWAVAFKPWYRIPEKEKDDPMQSSGDDNPDITDYMGHGETRLFYRDNGHVVTLMERNVFTSDGLGAVELDYSFPLNGKLRGYVQYFYGYGESLIDYNARSHRIGVGIAINDWF